MYSRYITNKNFTNIISVSSNNKTQTVIILTSKDISNKTVKIAKDQENNINESHKNLNFYVHSLYAINVNKRKGLSLNTYKHK